MADTLEILKQLALQVRNATGAAENTAERVGRTLVGILDLLDTGDMPTVADLFEKVNLGTDEAPAWAIRAKYGLYTDSWISAKGKNPSAGSTPVAGATELSKLTDVLITTPADGQVLAYDTALGKWVNREPVAGGLDDEELAEYLTNNNYAKKTDITAALSGYATTDWADGRYFRRKVSEISDASTDAGDLYAFGGYLNVSGGNSSFPNEYGILLNFALQDNDYRIQLYSASGGVLYFRTRYNALNSNWARIITSSGVGASGTWGIGITGNAASATKLQTARTIWGQPFNGTANVSGSLTGVADITASGTATVKELKTVPDGNGRYFHVTGSSLRIVPGNMGWAAGLSARDYTNTATTGFLCGAYGLAESLIYTFYGGTSYESPAMVILANKNVGIGTTNPVHKLHVNGGIYSDEYVQVGSARLKWDGTTGALYVEKADGTQCGFYATGFLSAKGLNDDAGGVSAGIDEGQLADYLTEHGYATQSWVTQQGYLTEVPEVDLSGYATQQWVNSQGFLKSVSLSTVSDLHGSWDALLKAAPSAYVTRWPTAAEVGALTQTTADGRYFRRKVSEIWDASTDAGDLYAFGGYLNVSGGNSSFPNEYGILLNFALQDNDYRIQLYSASGGVLYFRTRYNALNGNWARIITSSGVGASGTWGIGITGNAASATKLQTARTIWGQPFNGTSNVSGSLTGVADITASGTATVKELKTVPDGNGRSLQFTGSSLRIVPGNGGWAAGLSARDYTNTATTGFLCGAYGLAESLIYTFYGGTSYESPAMVILANKNVGIGTTNPVHKLHVAGVAYASTGIFSDGYVSAKGQNTSSDMRLKRIIGDVSLTPAQIAGAPAFRFRWKDGTGVSAGSSAQYWKELLPEAVDERNGWLEMQYGNIALLSVIALARTAVDHEGRIKRLERMVENN